jgi:hypothetical protein
MYRVTYIPMLAGFHWVADLFGPLGFYLANFVICCAILFMIAWVWSKILEIRVWAILVVVAAFFYSYDLFQYPSLQEKLLHLFGAPLLWFSISKSPGLFFRTLLVIAFTLAGVLSKSSFFIYVAMAWLAFLYSLWGGLGKRNLNAILALSIVTIIDLSLFLFIARVSKNGSYTAGGYSLERFLGNLFSPAAVVLIVPTFVLLYLVWRRGELFKQPIILLPAVGVMAYLTIFLPWGIGAYLLTIIAPTYAAMLILILDRLPMEWMKVTAFSGLILMALVFGIYRPYSMFNRLRDIGELGRRASEWKAAGVTSVVMPCMEGAVGMKKYFKNLGGEEIEVDFTMDKPKAGEPRWYIYDSGLCSMPWARGQNSDCRESESLYATPSRWGFRLVQIQCDAPGGG